MADIAASISNIQKLDKNALLDIQIKCCVLQLARLCIVCHTYFAGIIDFQQCTFQKALLIWCSLAQDKVPPRAQFFV